MGLLSGIGNAVKGAVGIATAPARTALKVVGTGLSTGGNVLGQVATGNLSGAAGALTDGVRQQAGNVTGFFTENVDNVKQIAGGHADFVRGGVGLIGEPIRGAARLTGNSLQAAGGALSGVATGDFNGAAGALTSGVSNGVNILGETGSNQVSHLL